MEIISVRRRAVSNTTTDNVVGLTALFKPGISPINSMTNRTVFIQTTTEKTVEKVSVCEHGYCVYCYRKCKRHEEEAKDAHSYDSIKPCCKRLINSMENHIHKHNYTIVNKEVL